MSNLPPDTLLSLSEASAILMLPPELLGKLLIDPFAAGSAEVTLRQVLACDVLCGLCMIAPETALPIAHTAGRDAIAGGSRLLAVGWIDGTPHCAWVSAVSGELIRTALVVPAEAMLARLATRLVQHRAAASRPLN
jgi:hypothetical protein